MSFLSELREKRLQLIAGLEANQGDINLSIFEDFYPDEAHFIYELLQNAEDADATEAWFELAPEVCVFEHNGGRRFSEGDIRSITGIFSSNKKDDNDKIGRFGVGFKSVYVYTDTPAVYSGDVSFEIEKYVVPREIARRPGLGERTRFEFPFNNRKKPAKTAFSEIQAGLEELSDTTLLFLRSIRSINWQCGQRSGQTVRSEHDATHIEVVRRSNGTDVDSSHWLRMMAPVSEERLLSAPSTNLDRQRVAVAFRLELTGDTEVVDPTRPLCEQMRIVAAKPGRVSVYFPAAKETSGLRFHLHAPFVPELSRASIKNSPENVPLFDQLSQVVASALHSIKARGLLTTECLAVLPNDDDDLPERYRVIRHAIVREMQEQPLVPTQRGAHAPGKRLVQGRAAIKNLLTDADLAFLLKRQDEPTWAVAATQKNSLVDRMLASLELKHWDINELVSYLKHATSTRFRDPARCAETQRWMSSKSDDWHRDLYAACYRELGDDGDYYWLRACEIVRVGEETYRVGTQAYFSTSSAGRNDPFDRVRAGIVSTGPRRGAELEASRFLELVGVTVPGEADEVKLLLAQRYADDSEEVDDAVYLADLQRFIALVDDQSKTATLFENALVFKIDAEEAGWAKPDCVYLDRPWRDTSLGAFYTAMQPERRERWALSSWYAECGIEARRLAQFAEAVGCATVAIELIDRVSCHNNENWDYLSDVSGQRYANPIDSDFALCKDASEMLESHNAALSALVWRRMCEVDSEVLVATYQRSTKWGRREAPSQLVSQLRDAQWIPLRDGSFVAPRRARREVLQAGLVWPDDDRWLKEIGFGAEIVASEEEVERRAVMRAELGLHSEEDFALALAIANLPAEDKAELRRLCDERARRAHELPTREVGDPALREARVRTQAQETPEKRSEVRQRSVRVGYGSDKEEVKLYLRDQYTNADGVMFCQACRDELPFKLPSGEYFFEAVEVVDEAPKRLREGFLALCPNHAAMYRYANEGRARAKDLLDEADTGEIELELGGRAVSVYFTEVHLQDLRTGLSSLDAGRAAD